MSSKIRKEASEYAQTYKREKELSYSDIEDMSSFSRKQISAILNCKSGISIEKIEEFFLEVFNVELESHTRINPNRFDDSF